MLEFLAEDGATQTISTTDEHPFWSVDAEDYIPAGDLQLGDHLIGPQGEIATLIGSRCEEHPEGVAVYNFEVSDVHNYYVRAHGLRAPPLRVHNAMGLGCGIPKRLTHRQLDGEVPRTQSISRMATKFERGRFEPTKRDLGVNEWNDIVRPGHGLSVDGVAGPNPALRGQPFRAWAGKISDLTNGRLKTVFRPIEGNPNHVQIEAAVEMKGFEFRDLLRRLFSEGIWE